MKLPGWFVRSAKPLYKSVQRVPVIGKGVRKLAVFVLSWQPRGLNWLEKKNNRLDAVERQMQQFALVMQGIDLANRTLYQQRSRDIDKVMQDTEGAINQVRDRVEFVRDEVMFELRKALNVQPPSGVFTDSPRVQTKLIKPERLQQRPLRLNLGCGHLSLQGYVNVDGRELPGVDLVADVTALPLEPNSVDEILASHLIEHFPQRYLQDVLLPYWHSLLAPGGVLRLILPDAEAMIAAYVAGEMAFDDLALVTFGKQDYDGDFHFVMFSQNSLSRLLKNTGFSRTELVASDRRNGLCREMELLAYRGKVA